MNTYKLICANTQEEGFGSVYERISLERLLLNLQKKYGFKNILECSCRITKGYDNLVFMEKGFDVSVSDGDIERIKKLWKFDDKPEFLELENNKKFDLTWNFALMQQQPELIKQMIINSEKYVLFFTPNVLNLGTPFHIVYHLISRTKCEHAERGSLKLRTRIGLKKVVKENNLEFVESGYVDIPWWPDTAFSIKEVKKNILHKEIKASELVPRNAYLVLSKIKKNMFIENNKVLRLFAPLFAHHTYVLAKVK